MGRVTRRGALAAAAAAALPALAAAQESSVRVTEEAETFTLSNGIVTARVSKRSGDLISLVYQGFETLSAESGHPYAYWSHDTTGGAGLETRITINPATNGGERAEVSVKGISGGKKMGHGPGAPEDGDIFADVEIRYALGRGEQGVHTWCIFDHPPEYAGFTMAEARFCAKLAKAFNYIHIDEMRSGPYPLLGEGTDKYVYTALQAQNRAYGFSSPEKKLGFWFLITSPEYLSGGPTKPEFLAHGTHPTVLSYWKSSHYTGSNVTVEEGRTWSRVVGPFMIYVNEGPTPQAMWADAKRKLAAEERQWPYEWARSPAFDNRAKRSSVRGRLVLDDPQAKGFSGDLWVGLSATPRDVPQGDGFRTITWQNDARHCQFWVRTTDRSGRFEIPNVTSGLYTITAFADGVIGEFAKADLIVMPGRRINVGDLDWRPVRRGRTLWQIGTPNRTATEYRGADQYFRPGVQFRYAQAFPNDVTFRPGRSDPAKDWFFAHQPHINGPAEIVEFSGVRGEGRATPWRIVFDLLAAGKGKATLRLAICATGPRSRLLATVNGKEIGAIDLGPDDGALTRHQIQGRWYEIEHAFDGDLLRQGGNELVLTVPAGPLNSGVVYDCLRLELDEDA